ncbi:hypothetical protein EVAR_40550_1 [Eumeta japonica]|uniref:Uncharacterized protein n=1 Tax=Eumeta variegata TaxID=151549 RepID=A0A4C1VWZ1_EUMVA|nr:hypothetical protein EVAR_40550_1 [Eumeta japonica]
MPARTVLCTSFRLLCVDMSFYDAKVSPGQDVAVVTETVRTPRRLRLFVGYLTGKRPTGRPDVARAAAAGAGESSGAGAHGRRIDNFALTHLIADANAARIRFS